MKAVKGFFKQLNFFYHNSRLKTKLFIIFGLSSLLPILMLWSISTKVNENSLTDKVNQMMTGNLAQIAERANMNLDIYTSLLYQMSKDEQLTNSLNTLSGQGKEGAVAYYQINKRLKLYSDAGEDIRCISVICANGTSVVYDTLTDSAVDNLWRNYSDLRMIPPFRDAEGKSGMVLTPTVIFLEEDEYSHYLHISRRIFDLNHLDRGSIATIVISVDARRMSEICNPADDAGEHDFNFIVAKDGTIICYPDVRYAGKRVDVSGDISRLAAFVSDTGIFSKRLLEVNHYHDEQTEWDFYNVYDRDDILKDVRRVQRIFLLVGGLALAAASFSILYFARQINDSVNEVVEGMKEIQEGNLDVVLPIHSDDEFGLIADNFNHMTNRVNDLIEEVRLAVAQQKNAEIRALEAQINPHFLYNTLDSINWIAIEKEEYEISKMLRDLGVILRYSIGKSNGMVSVTEMADWLEKYVGLQKIRFDNVFEYNITIEEDAKNCILHKLLLQPFIENAIVHGLKELEGGGMLRVDFTLSGDQRYLHITVEDNGVGMPREMAQKYNDVAWAVSDGGNSIGLHNAFSRMHMYYGDQASWKVTAMENMGTVIMLKLPVDRRGIDAYIDC